ncbi:alpha/beta fold hydrolase [Halopiger xanaduensis]|uniref:Alpha/beta hydrolase fold protein n=1 Tax=Halopiger xanaduensis (strain DSM 18323 / JCM 14033 / SH-6) TaxID=797210 RepID=F8D3E6_HALXS|nr:alpha/beta hydrolase [Halopiger xanaduensis]AEH36172.1 alpha/beta hydrolase fold protein [Halopiger xanaduensis SH-6]
MPRATRDDVSIYYEHEKGGGDGAADPVVLLQGLGFGRWMWRWQREALRDKYQVIAPDTRGTGRSDAGLPPLLPRLPGRLRTPLLSRFGYSIEGLAADLEAVLEDAGVRSAHIVGASLGGMVAQQYAVEYPRASSLTLLCTSHGGPDAAPIPEDVRQQLLAGGGDGDRKRLRDSMRPVFSERFTNRNPHLMDRIVEWRREQDAGGPARIAQGAAVSNFDVADRLASVRVPTLIMHGTDDRVVPPANARLLAERIPDAELEHVDGGSHCFFVERDDRVNESLLSFLAEQER